LTVCFALLGSEQVRAASKILMKLTPDEEIIGQKSDKMRSLLGHFLKAIPVDKSIFLTSNIKGYFKYKFNS